MPSAILYMKFPPQKKNSPSAILYWNTRFIYHPRHFVRTEKLSLTTLVQMDGLPKTIPKKIGFKTKSDEHIAAQDMADTDFLGGVGKLMPFT